MMKKILLMVLLAAPLSLAAQKFAHFDYAAIMQSMPEMKTVQAELEVLGKQYQDELAGMEKELQTMYEKYQAEINEQTPENIRNRKMQELQDKQARLQQASEDNTKAFQEAQQKKMQPLIVKVTDAINAVMKEGNYVYIIDKASSQAAGMFINETLSEEVTKKIMAKLGISLSATAPAATTK